MPMNYDQLASKDVVDATITALEKNGITAEFVPTGAEAKEKALALIPEGAEVMTMTSVTNHTIGLVEAIDGSGKYNSVRNKLTTMDRKTQSVEMQKLGAAPEYTTGSAHAITQDGKIMIASNTGSQLAAEVYGSAHVILVVGTQKIVKDIDGGMKRIYDYILPKESVRLNNQYHINTGSFVSKLLIINREVNKGRIHVIFVNEVLGF